MGFVNGEEGDGNALEPLHGVGTRQPFRREVQQPEFTGHSLAHNLRLLVRRHRAIKHSRGDSHLRELCHLVLHQGDQRRNDHDGLARSTSRPAVDSTVICRRRSASPRRHRGPPADWRRYAPVRDGMTRSPSNVVRRRKCRLAMASS